MIVPPVPNAVESSLGIMGAIITNRLPHGCKKCKACPAIVVGPRTKICPSCKTPFTFKEKVAKQPKSTRHKKPIIKPTKSPVEMMSSASNVPPAAKSGVVFNPPESLSDKKREKFMLYKAQIKNYMGLIDNLITKMEHLAIPSL